MLHDVEVLGRSLVEALEPKLKQSGASATNELLSTKWETHWENKFCHNKLITDNQLF